MQRLFKKQQNYGANCIISHILDVIKSMVINTVKDALSRLGSFNQPLRAKPVVTGMFLVSLLLIMSIILVRVVKPL